MQLRKGGSAAIGGRRSCGRRARGLRSPEASRRGTRWGRGPRTGPQAAGCTDLQT